MKNWKSDLNRAGGGILLSCILLLVACACADGSEPAGRTTQDSPTTAATPPNEMAVALKEIPVWEAQERVCSALTGEVVYDTHESYGKVTASRQVTICRE